MACHTTGHCSSAGCVVVQHLAGAELPLIEGIILVIHCFGFFGILIPLWVLSPRPTASEVFGPIQDRGGWGNNGLACLVGLVGSIYALIGAFKYPKTREVCHLLTISTIQRP